ncbi:MAG: hypothetical protein JWN70_2448 [Planctomycetaceae bacterium]|nr:hypothetical protein [Planctomycetaceae bacterium]
MSRSVLWALSVIVCVKAYLIDLSLPAIASEVAPQSKLLIEMPASVVQAIEGGIRKYPHSERNPARKSLYDFNQKNALESLTKLRKLRWPDYSKLKLVQITDVESKCPPRQIHIGWIHSEEKGSCNLLTTENAFVSLPSERYRVEPFSFERYWKSERLRFQLDKPELGSEYLSWVTGNEKGGIQSRQQDALDIFHFFYLAAMFDKSNDLTKLLDRELGDGRWDREGPLEHTWWNLHKHRRRKQLALLQSGAPFVEVLAYWKETEQLFDDAELQRFTQRLERQITEDRDIKDLDPTAIARLTPDEQVRYWILRLPQDRGDVRYSIILSNDPGQSAASSLSKLDWAAVPQLIDALRDTRITRTLHQAEWDSPTYVLRVQDLAWTILTGFFNEPSQFQIPGDVLSVTPPHKQEETVRKIETWWQENGGNSERDWWLSRLKSPAVQVRVRALKTLEQLDATAVNSASQLLKWVESVENDELLVYCDLLRQRGFSDRIPRLEQWLDQQRKQGYKRSSSTFWLRHGQLRDFQYLQQSLRMKTQVLLNRDDRLAVVFRLTSGLPWGNLEGQAYARFSLFAIPLLVDILDRDRLVGLPHGKKRNYMSELSSSESAFQALQELTGHKVDWNRKGAMSARVAAMNSWLAWWHETGKVEYLRQHPEVQPLFEDAWQKGQQITTNNLKEMVEVEDPRDYCRMTYQVPRESVAQLVANGTLLVNTVPQFADRFRFATPSAAETWFRSASSTAGRPLPCMVVPIADSIEMDSQRRIWCRWNALGYPPAVFEKGKWTSFSDQRHFDSVPLGTFNTDSRSFLVPPRAGSANSMWFPTMIVGECSSETEFDLHDDEGWLHFRVPELTTSPAFDRIVKTAPQPKTNQHDYQQFLRDEVGRLFITQGNIKLIEKGRELPFSTHLRNLHSDFGHPRGVIGNGDVWLVTRYSQDGQSIVAARAVEQGQIVEKSLPLASKAGVPHVWINDGPVESSDPAKNRDRWTTAYDVNGNVAARHAGHHVGIDPCGGHWLALGPRGPIASLARINPDGKKHSWKNQNKGRDIWLRGLADLTFAPDGTIWLPLGNELIHLGYDDDAIKEIERFPLPESNWTSSLCDVNGDVWLACDDDGGADEPPRAYRFATHGKSPGK